MRVLPTTLDGVKLFAAEVHRDARGWFLEAWQARRYHDAGLSDSWSQVNVARSGQGTLRGLHLQHPGGQAKLVVAVDGSIWDVAVDVRHGSPTFGHWFGAELSEENAHQLFVPEGFAHGYVVCSEAATVLYFASQPYRPEAELVVRWDDPSLNITWPVTPTQLSQRDRTAPLLRNVAVSQLPAWRRT